MSEVLNAVKSLGKQVETTTKSIDARLTSVEKALDKPNYGAGRVALEAKDHKAAAQWGFESFGHFAREVIDSKRKGSPTEKINKSFSADFVQKSAAGMGELVGSDGGFMVPPTFSQNIFERMYEENSLLSKTDSYPITGNSIVFPRNAESSRANGSRWGGVQAYWRQEGTAGTQSRPTFGRLTLNLHKLFCLAAITSELMEDSGTALDQYLNRVFSDEINFNVGDSIINGTGAGMPLGILNAAAKVSVSKETGQAAATITTENIVKMWSRLYRGSQSKAVWYVNQDTAPALYLMTIGIGTAGTTTYMPPGGLSGKPYATILGAPVIETEFNPTLGTEGDIILADLSQYVTAHKGTPKAEASMHLYFDTDEQAFRVTYRIDGQPWWAAPLTPFKGTNTQSCIVTLETRS